MSRILKAASRVRSWFPRGRGLPPETERENVHRVLDAAGDGIYGVDDTGRITFVNRTLCELVGADRADARVG
jgi:PAS domain-containing protein